MMFVRTIHLCALLISSVSAIQPGLELVNPPRESGSECLESELTYRCTTTGRGRTQLIFEDIAVPTVQFRHGLYISDSPNQDDNQSYLDGDVRVGNLSRSNSEQCLNNRHNTSDCYTTSIIIRVANKTMCGIIVCRTVFTPDAGPPDEITEFGRANIARILPPPANLSVRALSPESLTVIWEAGTSVNCSAIIYVVSTNSNCGSCSPLMTGDRNVTCKDPVAGEICNVAIRSMLECDVYSNSSPLEVKVPETSPPSTSVNVSETSPSSTDNRVAIGIGVGVPVLVLTIVGVITGVILIPFFRRRKSSNSHAFQPVPEDTLTKSDPKVPVQELESTLSEAKVDSEDHAVKVNGDQQPLLNNTKVDSEGPVGDTSVEEQPVPPSDSTTSEDGEELDGGSNMNAAQNPVLPNSVTVPSQHGDTNPAIRSVQTKVESSDVQTFNATVEKTPTNVGAAFKAGVKSPVPNNKGEVTAKMSMELTGEDNGQSLTIGIKGNGAHATIEENSTDKRLTDLETNVHEAKREREEAKREREEAKMEREEAKRERKEAKREREQLQRQTHTLQKEKEELQTKIDQLTTEISNLQQEIKTIRAKYEKESEEQRSHYEQEVDKLSEKIKDLEKKLKAAHTRIQELEDENTTLKNKIAEE